jgi:hypothetical protein
MKKTQAYDSFEDRCGFLGSTLLDMLKEKHDSAGFYIEGVKVDPFNCSKDGIEKISQCNTNGDPLVIYSIEVFMSHIDSSTRAKILMRYAQTKE